MRRFTKKNISTRTRGKVFFWTLKSASKWKKLNKINPINNQTRSRLSKKGLWISKSLFPNSSWNPSGSSRTLFFVKQKKKPTFLKSVSKNANFSKNNRVLKKVKPQKKKSIFSLRLPTLPKFKEVWGVTFKNF